MASARRRSAASVAWWREAALAEMARGRAAAADPVRRHRACISHALTKGLAAIPPIPAGGAGGGARAAGGDGRAGAARGLAESTRRPPPAAAQRRPAHRPRLGGAGAAPAAASPSGSGSGTGRAGAVALRRHPAGPAARGAARRHRPPVRRHAARRARWRRCGRCWPSGLDPALAGDAGAWGAGAGRAICAASSAAGGGAGRRDRLHHRRSTPSGRRPGSGTMRWPTQPTRI